MGLQISPQLSSGFGIPMFPHYNDTMKIVYYEDIKLHAKYRSKPYFLTEQTIVEFAQQWDPGPLHVDAEFAKASSYGALIAPAALLLAIWMKLVREQEPKVAYTVGLGWKDVQLVAAARSGDTIIWEEELLSKRESKSNSTVGILSSAHRLLNQRDEPVVTFQISALVEKRPR